MPLDSLLSAKKKHLTAAQQRAVKYITENYEDAVFLTASSLSRRIGVSEATIVRLAQALGFHGFRGMQRMLRESFQNRLSTDARLEHTVKHAKTDEEVLVKVVQEDIRNLTQTLESLSIETFEQAVTEMATARKIFVVGLKGSHSTAVVLARYLGFLREGICLVQPGHGDIWDSFQGVDEKDLVVGISFPRYTQLTVDALEYANIQGAKVGAITDSLFSPLADYAHWVLPVRHQLDSFIESYTAVVSLINALLTALSIRNPQETLAALKKRETLWKEKDIYWAMPAERNRK
ncbi:MAG: MurR/RpiR family transcriptional regulator [Deltaproteobacteria bacterium]|nr:MurR/RpiR family transcriptional regulator [Deltaproteobacteria bacterium]